MAGCRGLGTPTCIDVTPLMKGSAVTEAGGATRECLQTSEQVEMRVTGVGVGGGD